jgi:SMC interacting uncharacterized protein involved in chromosome segregation
VELRKKERDLLKQIKVQEITIFDIKKQVQRTNEINRTLIEKTKERDIPLQKSIQERDEAAKQLDRLLQDLKAFQEQTELIQAEKQVERTKCTKLEKEL